MTNQNDDIPDRDDFVHMHIGKAASKVTRANFMAFINDMEAQQDGTPAVKVSSDALDLGAGLTAFAILAGAANKLAYFVSETEMALTDLVAGARSFLADPSAAFVSFLQSGTGAIARMLNVKLGEIKSVADYGVSPSASAADNLANFKKAVAACTVGDVLYVPAHLNPVVVDTTGGLSAAIEVNKRITIELRGDVKANFSAVQVNPPYVFNFTAEGSGITGPGRVIGDGAVSDLSDGTTTAERIPGLVRLNANNTFCRGVTFVTPPQVGLMLYSCYGSDVSGNRFTGGVTSYHSAAAASQTAHFGVYAAGGGRNRYCDNWFYPDAGGGMVIQCFFANGSNHNNIFSRNYAYRPYEKLLYWYGDSNRVSDNYVLGNTGTIPGTNMQGTIGAVIRMYGEYNVVSKNYTKDCGAGAAIWDGVGNQVVDNQFLDCGAAGIGVLGSTTGLSKTRVDRNVCTQAAQVGNIVADGIEVTVSHATASTQISVCDNVSIGFSINDPIVNVPVWAPNTTYGKISTVKPLTVGLQYRVYDPLSTTTGGISGASEPAWNDNPGSHTTDGTITWVCRAYGTIRNEIRVSGNASGKISASRFSGNNVNGRRAIALEHVNDSEAPHNTIDATEYHMMEATCSRIRWLFNTCLGAGDKTVFGRGSSSTFVDYSYTGTATYDPASLADGDGAVTTVTVTGAVLGDFAEASFSLDLQGITLTAWVSAANTVSVRFQNETGGVVDLASGTLSARAMKG